MTDTDRLYHEMMAAGHTFREFESIAFPDVKEWDDAHDKTRKQPPLPGFTKCRNCAGTGFIPAGPLPGITGLSCSHCAGKGIVAVTP